MDYLEPESQEAYDTWAKDKTPDANASILRALDPVVNKGTSMYGGGSPLARSRARRLTLEGLESYDRNRARLQSHLLNQMKSLQRITRQQNEVVRAPERVVLDKMKLKKHEQELVDTLGRDPSDSELSNHSGFSLKRINHVRNWQPGVGSGQLSSIDQNLAGGSFSGGPATQAAWLEIVYDSLPALDQKVMELSMGLHGRKALSNQEIARKLGRSPGAISQRKKNIQELIRQEESLSPFSE